MKKSFAKRELRNKEGLLFLISISRFRVAAKETSMFLIHPHNSIAIKSHATKSVFYRETSSSSKCTGILLCLLEYILIIAWLVLAGVSNMAYFADENQNHNNSGRS